jgi:hypothetical protein
MHRGALRSANERNMCLTKRIVSHALCTVCGASWRAWKDLVVEVPQSALAKLPFSAAISLYSKKILDLPCGTASLDHK